MRSSSPNTVYLDPLDWLMRESGFEMVRYADDIVVLCRSREEAAAALGKLGGWMGEAKLTLHPDKTRTVDMGVAGSYFDFLGYRFMGSRSGNLVRLVRPKSLRKLRETIKPKTRRNNGKRRAVCGNRNDAEIAEGKSARTVRRGERRKPMRRSYLYQLSSVR